MERILSNYEETLILVNNINLNNNYKAKIKGPFTKLCFAGGETIQISKGFFNTKIDLVKNKSNLIYYTNDGNIGSEEKSIILDIEQITMNEILVRDKREITLGGH